VDLFALVGGIAQGATALQSEEGPGLVINGFWIIVSAANFLFFLFLIWTLAFKPISGMLSMRRERIERGLKDAEQARLDRESADQERRATLAEARRESNEILARAQKVAQETRDADIAATRERFKALSALAVTMELPQDYAVAFCPMYKGGSKWVQKKDKIANPYYGSQMLTCGSFVN